VFFKFCELRVTSKFCRVSRHGVSRHGSRVQVLQKQQLHLELGHFILVALRYESDLCWLLEVTRFVRWARQQSLALAFFGRWRETRVREALWVERGCQGLLKETPSFSFVSARGS
jgi:hypothetical protein